MIFKRSCQFAGGIFYFRFIREAMKNYGLWLEKLQGQQVEHFKSKELNN